MGKKVIKQQQALSSKISKQDHSKHQHQQLNSLIKVLRPKVYITDSSSFKKLVQQLTGNGNLTSSTSTSTYSTPPPAHDDDHPQVQLNNVETLPASFNTEAPNTNSTASYSGFCDLDQFWINSEIMCLEENDAVLVDQPGLDEINYIESLLFDEQLVEQQIPFYGQVEQDISIYDYDFSGFIN